MDSHTHPEISGLHSRVSGVESSVSRLRNRVDALEKNLLRRVGELQRGAVISGALVVTALVSVPVTSALGVLLLGLAVGVLGYTALERFVLLRARLQSIADTGSREKSEIKNTLIRASDELATLFSQEQRRPSSADFLRVERATGSAEVQARHPGSAGQRAGSSSSSCWALTWA